MMVLSIKNTYFYILFLQLCFVLILSTQAYAMPDINKLADVKLVIGEYVEGSKEATIGLDINLHGGWKTYWVVPGDAGLAPVLDWSKSQNIENTPEIIWPMPKRFETYGLQNIGYSNRVLFPIKITAKDAKQPIEISLDVNLLLCDEICVPFQKSINDFVLLAPRKNDGALKKAISKLPKLDTGISLKEIKSYKSTTEDDILSISLLMPKEYLNKKVKDIFINNAEGLFFDTPKVDIQPYENKALLTAEMLLRIPLYDDRSLMQVLDEDPGFSLVVDFKKGQDVFFDLSNSSSIEQSVVSKSILLIVFFAFVGGVILNVMPCVLPVLSLKFLSLIKSSDKTAKHVRIGFITSALGIMCAFWVMALFLSVLKIGGHSIGWGMQFQHTGFLAFLCAILILFSLNLFGVFEISVPKFISSKLPNSSHYDHDSIMGHFLTGVLAAVLATPCSAPFLGTAVGFALSQNIFMIFLIFSFLGLGLASPYLLVATFPVVARHMPKPGAWMMAVKKAMGVALLLTALWLGSIVVNNYMGRSVDNVDSLWQEFNQAEIKSAVIQQKVVLVDITAEWCLTCKANKRFVLDKADLKALLGQENIIAMRGDWTQMDEQITQYINSFGRYGIPLNVVYGPKAPEGILLPELLSKKALKDAFYKAGLPQL